MVGITTRIEPISRDIEVIFREELSPQARSAHLADAARQAIEEAKATNKRALGYVPPVEIAVDGRVGARLEAVKPDGVIVAEFELVNELFVWIAEQLRKHSPVLTGQYRASHAFLADNTEILPDEVVPEASEYVFVSVVPYARKIERGLSQQAPDGVYQGVAVLASRRFGNLARIRFGYRSVLAGAGRLTGLEKWAAGTKMNARGRKGAKRQEWLRRQPAIIITVR